MEDFRLSIASLDKDLHKVIETGPQFRAKQVRDFLVAKVNRFEQTLDEDKQTGGRLVGFHEMTFGISDVGYQNPDILIFYGKLADGSEVELIQHISQMNLLLLAIPKIDPTKERKLIGFSSDNSDTHQKA